MKQNWVWVVIGKLHLYKTIADFVFQAKAFGMNILPINEADLDILSTLPCFTEHKDPFDRLIIATAIVNDFSIISVDKNFELYKNLIEIIY